MGTYQVSAAAASRTGSLLRVCVWRTRLAVVAERTLQTLAKGLKMVADGLARDGGDGGAVVVRDSVHAMVSKSV
jgi:hypothetical protein